MTYIFWSLVLLVGIYISTRAEKKVTMSDAWMRDHIYRTGKRKF